MISSPDESYKRAHALISEAQQLYATSEEVEEVSMSEKCCEDALLLLDKCENGIAKSVLVCEANIWLFASILKRMRLLHVALDPLNSSDDLFAPTPSRDSFIHKPLEKLCPESFCDGFSRLDGAHEAAYRVWVEEIMPRYESLKFAAEKRAAIYVTNKLASISLYSSHPFCAFNLFRHLWNWTRTAAPLRWLTTLLVAFGFPNSAAKYFESDNGSTTISNLKSDKYATVETMEQIKRLASFSQIKEGTMFNDTKASRDPSKSFATTVRYRLASLTAFVDCFAVLQQSNPALTENLSLVGTMMRARQRAGQLFLMQNKMDTCPTLPSLEDSQHYMDTFWYLNILLNEALVQQRSGRVEWSARSLYEGYSIAFILCSPYWLAKFTTHLAFLKSLNAINDKDISQLERLVFVRRIFSPNGTKRISALAMESKSFSERTPMKEYNSALAADCSCSDVMTVELSRRIENEREMSVKKKVAHSNDGQAKSARLLSTSSSSSVYCHCCIGLMELNEAIFQIVLPQDDTSSNIPSTDLKAHCFKVLHSHIRLNGRKGCSHHDSAPFDHKEIAAFLNEPLWNLLDFYLLLSSLQNVGVISEEIAMVENALGLLTSAASTLFSLYYRLTFSVSLVQRKLAPRLLADSQPDDDKENKPKRGRPRKQSKSDRKATTDKEDLGKIVDDLISDVGKYMHLQYYPWYRWARQLMGLVHMPSVSARRRLDIMPECPTLSAVNFLESSSVSFRHSVMAKESASAASKLCQFRDEQSLKAALAKLPTDWTVVSLQLVTILSYRRLIVCRLRKGCQPVIEDLGDVIGDYDVVSEFASFIQEVDESIKITDKKQFWDRRHILEKKLAHILHEVEKRWFGDRRALLVPEPSDCGPVFLILDKELHGIPWENMPILRGKPVSRTPCLQSLLRSLALYPSPKQVSKERVFYIVNPSGDLKSTEDFFKYFSRVNKWTGICGSQPELSKMEEMLESNEIYIYCGHNSGVKCMQPLRRIEQLSCNAAVVLMGCGSGKAINHGPLFEPETVPYSYLVADSPSVIGCLWSITAPDIDKYLAEVLKLWLNVVPPTDSTKDKFSRMGSLLHAIAQAKSACKLPLLTGAAVVSFGLPVFCD